MSSRLFVEEELFNPPENFIRTPLLRRVNAEGSCEYYLEKDGSEFNIYFSWTSSDYEDDDTILNDMHQNEEHIKSFATCKSLIEYCQHPSGKAYGHITAENFQLFCKDILNHKVALFNLENRLVR